ncbi:MAG: electron transfer flavoprotein subunit beta/FixA family protein [Chloroflexi bacterium]|nr:electron transfer flavoprotein subunit beta/FixA family protein [Chloroflexota bacterium]
MNVFVCVKQIPDPSVGNQFDLATKRLKREGVEAILDNSDEYGVEAGLQLVEKHGGSVAVISMGPDRAKEAIRKSLAMGVERGVLLSDPALAGSDVLGTAKALAAALKQEQFDVVICSTESTDASTGLLPGHLAELLGVPLLSYARTVEVDGNKIRTQRQTESGYQVIEADLPVVMSVTWAIAEPRYPSLKGIMTAKRKEITELNVGALGIDPSEVGEAGAREKVLTIVRPEERKSGEMVTDEGEGGKQIADFLQRQRLI